MTQQERLEKLTILEERGNEMIEEIRSTLKEIKDLGPQIDDLIETLVKARKSISVEKYFDTSYYTTNEFPMGFAVSEYGFIAIENKLYDGKRRIYFISEGRIFTSDYASNYINGKKKFSESFRVGIPNNDTSFEKKEAILKEYKRILNLLKTIIVETNQYIDASIDCLLNKASK